MTLVGIDLIESVPTARLLYLLACVAISAVVVGYSNSRIANDSKKIGPCAESATTLGVYLWIPQARMVPEGASMVRTLKNALG